MTIPSVEWAQKYKLKTTRLNHLYKDFLKTKTTELANKYIVDRIIETMRQNDVHRKIYESVIVESVQVNHQGIRIRISSEYFAESGFDVALAREEGTEDHMIRPLGKASGGADYLAWIQGGVKRFSAGHMVSGLPPLNLIARGIELGEFELQNALNEEGKKWRREILR